MLPRPELSTLLGIGYRRIPVLAIGNDVYCDTSLVASVLERRFPMAKGYGTIFPPRKGGGKADTGMIKAFSQFYVDRMLFGLAAATLKMENMPQAFIKDRKDVSVLVPGRTRSWSIWRLFEPSETVWGRVGRLRGCSGTPAHDYKCSLYPHRKPIAAITRPGRS